MIRICPICQGNGVYYSEGQLLDHTFDSLGSECGTCRGHGFVADTKEEFDAEVIRIEKEIEERVTETKKSWYQKDFEEENNIHKNQFMMDSGPIHIEYMKYLEVRLREAELALDSHWESSNESREYRDRYPKRNNTQGNKNG